mgnify:CR=1 FL=1
MIINLLKEKSTERTASAHPEGGRFSVVGKLRVRVDSVRRGGGSSERFPDGGGGAAAFVLRFGRADSQLWCKRGADAVVSLRRASFRGVHRGVVRKCRRGFGVSVQKQRQ